MRYSMNLVFDCSYDEHMTSQESRNTGKQLSLCFAMNRQHNRPFSLHLCNVDRRGTTMHALHKWIPTIYNKSFPLQLHEESFTEIFPKEHLVYLTPHSKNVLEEFNPNDVYVIGSYVDKGASEPISLAKAKKADIRMARLPIERYLQWGVGSKYLPLNIVCQILLEIRYTKDWNAAMTFVPRRKLY